jgi:hypothetical protein
MTESRTQRMSGFSNWAMIPSRRERSTSCLVRGIRHPRYSTSAGATRSCFFSTPRARQHLQSPGMPLSPIGSYRVGGVAEQSDQAPNKPRQRVKFVDVAPQNRPFLRARDQCLYRLCHARNNRGSVSLVRAFESRCPSGVLLVANQYTRPRVIRTIPNRLPRPHVSPVMSLLSLNLATDLHAVYPAYRTC